MRRPKAKGTKRTPIALVIVLALGAGESRADPLYTITDIGTLPGTSQSVAMGINASGQVVGISYNSGDGSMSNPAGTTAPPTFDQNGSGAESFLYSGGQLTQISPTGGLATSLNASGQIVGGQYSSINDAGQYVGGPYSGINTGSFPSEPGLLVTNGITTSLPSSFSPYAINNSGEIAGFIIVGTGGGSVPHAAIYQSGQVQDLSSLLPTGPGYTDTRAIAINQAGDLLINAGSPTTLQTYLYNATSHSLTNITASPGGSGMYGAALNDNDQVVGNGFLYNNGTIVSLASLLPLGSGWSNLNATGINDAGQIVGQGLFNGQEQAFVMSPVGIVPVPEPSALMTLAALPAGLALQRLAQRLRA
jgi:hypothetical protein